MQKGNFIGWGALLIAVSFAAGARWMHRCWLYSGGEVGIDNA